MLIGQLALALFPVAFVGPNQDNATLYTKSKVLTDIKNSSNLPRQCKKLNLSFVNSEWELRLEDPALNDNNDGKLK